MKNHATYHQDGSQGAPTTGTHDKFYQGHTDYTQHGGRGVAKSGHRRLKSGSKSSKSPVLSVGEGSDNKRKAMIEKEMAHIEKIKQRQQKEIEAMLDAERKQQEIQMRNELKERME